MHRFVHERHKTTFEVFYKELTGNPLERMTSHSNLLPTKRKITVSQLKEKDSGPKSKVRKTHHEGKGQVREASSNHGDKTNLSTSLLSSDKHLNTSAHLNQGRT